MQTIYSHSMRNPKYLRPQLDDWIHRFQMHLMRFLSIFPFFFFSKSIFVVIVIKLIALRCNLNAVRNFASCRHLRNALNYTIPIVGRCAFEVKRSQFKRETTTKTENNKNWWIPIDPFYLGVITLLSIWCVRLYTLKLNTVVVSYIVALAAMHFKRNDWYTQGACRHIA